MIVHNLQESMNLFLAMFVFRICDTSFEVSRFPVWDSTSVRRQKGQKTHTNGGIRSEMNNEY